MQTTTRWLPVDGYKNYEVSDAGQVRNKSTGLILKPGISNGYKYVNLCRPDCKPKYMQVHRLVAIAFIPNPSKKKCVDHIDGDRLNNCVENLRWATGSENAMNSSQRSDNSSGYKGVHFDKSCNKWQAQIKKDGKKHHLGYFSTAELASEAYNLAAVEFFGEYARLNTPIVKIPITITLKPTIDS